MSSLISDTLFRLNKVKSHDPQVDEWLSGDPAPLFRLAREWFACMRRCGDDVNETLHDGCPTACVGDAAFAYVNVFKAHVNVGFFTGASLDDPEGLLEGSGKRMRHVKLRPGDDMNSAALRGLIVAAYEDVKGKLIAG
jgi:hypothetical protein